MIQAKIKCGCEKPRTNAHLLANRKSREALAMNAFVPSTPCRIVLDLISEQVSNPEIECWLATQLGWFETARISFTIWRR